MISYYFLDYLNVNDLKINNGKFIYSQKANYYIIHLFYPNIFKFYNNIGFIRK